MDQNIRPIPYSVLDGNIHDDWVNGMTFSTAGSVLLLSSYPIKKYYPTYFETVITSYDQVSYLRRIPLYLGIHKDPTPGTLLNDFCLCPIFYEIGKDYYTLIRQNGNDSSLTITTPQCAMPIINSVIGVGIDPNNKTITIYNNGNVFYSVNIPFDINNDDNFYLAVYKIQQINMAGYVAYGRYNDIKNKPSSYWSLYDSYFNISTSNTDINSSITVGEIPGLYDLVLDNQSTINVTNNIAPIDSETNTRNIPLYFRYSSMQDSSNNMIFNMQHRDNINYLTDTDMMTISLPIPIYPKIYFEFNIKQATMNSNYIGIPVSLGITTMQNNNISQKSFRINLWHIFRNLYNTYIVRNSNQTLYNTLNLSSDVLLEEPNTIGVIIDLYNSIIKLYTEDGYLFSTIQLPPSLFNDLSQTYYAFISADNEAFSNSFYGIINFGQNPLEISIDEENYQSLYDYYNSSIKIWLSNYPELDCIVRTLPYELNYNKDITSMLIVNNESNDEKIWSPGLNKMYGTYNTISNTTPKNNQPIYDIFTYKQLIQNDLKFNINK